MSKVANGTVKAEMLDVVIAECVYVMEKFYRIPTFAIRNKKKRAKSTEYRYRLWGTDASGYCVEAIVAPIPKGWIMAMRNSIPNVRFH